MCIGLESTQSFSPYKESMLSQQSATDAETVGKLTNLRLLVAVFAVALPEIIICEPH